ncbi:MAG: cupredoxin domain-containing protein [Candidatus Nitrosopumilus sp. bin_68KS]
MNHKFLLIIFSLILIFSLTEFAYAGGSGSEESDTLYINENYLKIKIETNPSILKGNENQITFDITTINDDTQQVVYGIEYNVKVFDGQGNLVVDFDAYSPDEKLETIITPSKNLNFLGETIQNGAWVASKESPLTIEAPLFLKGGLVDVQIKILSIDSEPVTGDDIPFEILFTMGEFIPFTSEIDGITYDLTFATYFDKIEEFHYDEKNKKLSAQMPFNWDKNFIETIPFVHAEYYIPKIIDIFNNHEILMTVNDVSFFGTIDRSGNDEIVVHFLLSSKKLLNLIDEIPSENNDKMIFGIESGKKRDIQKKDASLEAGDKVIVLSSEEDWKFHLSLLPKGKINPGNEIIMNIEFHDPITNTIITQNVYDLDVFLNGKIIESKKGLEATDGTDSVNLNFDEIGAAIIRISNVNNFDTTGEFSFKVSEPQVELIGDHFVDISIGSSLPECEKNDSCYVPSILNVELNQVVLWKNKDSSAHTVSSGTPDIGVSEIFDSGIIGAAKNYSFKFENNGVFDYFCTLHPWMVGTIKVGTFESSVPDWVKNNAAWWSDGQINDSDFAIGLEYLIKENVIDVPKDIESLGTSENTIPDWLRNTAKWWSDGMLSDSEFLKGIEWMISNGIIKI